MRTGKQTEPKSNRRYASPIAQSKFNQSRRFYFNRSIGIYRVLLLLSSCGSILARCFTWVRGTWTAACDDHFSMQQRRPTDDKNNKVVSSAITDHLLQHIYWMFIWFRVSLEFPLSFLIFSFTLFHRNAFSISSDVDASALGSGRRSRTLHACTRYLRTHNLCIGNYHNNKP